MEIFLETMYRIKRFFARIYWKVFKPHTRGIKVILAYNKRVLLVNHRGSKVWNLPGGGVKKNESFKTAAKREVWEELKINAKNLGFFGNYLNKKEGKIDNIQIFTLSLRSEQFSRGKKEIKKAQFFPLAKLPSNTSSATKKRVSEYLTGKKPNKTINSW
jgi:8-oxo-dGTP pyrophosphatase MutT (NUDIX family)